jgi:outer membrane protein assembly factor BamD
MPFESVQRPRVRSGARSGGEEAIREFVKEHPDAVLSMDAEKNIGQIREKEAQASYDIAVFYEKQRVFDSARIYYEDVINNYSDSQWAAKAAEKLQIMEHKNEKKD